MKGLCVCVNNNNDDVNYCSLIKPKVNIGKKTITNSILLWVPRLGHKSYLLLTLFTSCNIVVQSMSSLMSIAIITQLFMSWLLMLVDYNYRQFG